MEDSTRLKLGKRVFWIGFGGNIVLAVLKAIVGFFTGSTAMLADAFHSASDVLSTAVAVGGVRLAHQPPDEQHHYGHAKAESIAAKIVAIILIVTAIGIGWQAIQIIRENQLSVPGSAAIWAAAISLIVKELMFRYTYKIGREMKSTVVVADAWHHRSDAFSSIAALIGIIGANFGFPILDPLAGAVVAILIFKMGINVYWRAVKELMDTAPDVEVIDNISKIAKNTGGVRSVHDVKARLNGPHIFVDMKICVDRYATVEEGHSVAVEAKENIKEELEEVKDVLIHVDPCYQADDNGDCNRCSRRKQLKENS